ncbi:hypothetical protein [Domibacillus tundrae]|uniref:hypothetical protein n=1 Tax=Domibacillus tundrae TaxID=1587527 RepID=UPI0006182D38|nr:hypothetical protein [Domibacillus tundrae]
MVCHMVDRGLDKAGMVCRRHMADTILDKVGIVCRMVDKVPDKANTVLNQDSQEKMALFFTSFLLAAF